MTHQILPLPELGSETSAGPVPVRRHRVFRWTGFAGLSVQARLLLIIAACLLPTLALQAAVGWTQLAERRAQLSDLAQHQAELLAGTVDNVANGARILLGAAAELDQVRSAGRDCGPRLASLRRHAPGFAFIALADHSGGVICASDPTLYGERAPGWAAEWGQGAAPPQRFTAGRFTRTPLRPGGVLPFHFPLPASAGEEARILVAALDLNWLSDQLRALKRDGSPFLAGGVLTVADAQGVILARDIRHAEFVGRSFPPEALALTQATEPGILRIRSIDGLLRLIGYTPPTPANHNLSAVVGFSEQELMADLERALLRGALLMVGLSAVVFILTLLAARRFIARPARALLATAEEWRGGNFAARAPDCGPGSEFGQLAAAWNGMAAALRQREDELREHAEELERRVADRTRELVEANDRLSAEVAERQQTQAALLQAQKVQAVGQLAGGIAHDFNNVLQAVLGGICLVRRRAGDPEAVGRLAGMVEEAARRGESVTRRLLAFSRREELRADALEVGVLLEGLHEVLAATLGARIRVGVDVAPDLPPVFADRGQLETVLVNLATNARDAMPRGGTLTLSARPSGMAAPEEDLPACLPAGSYVRLIVADTGEGMAPEVLARASEPFFTTKPLGQGTGLGLAMARSFAKGSAGALAIESAPRQGTRVSLWLPVARPAQAKEAAGSLAAPLATGGETQPRPSADAPARDAGARAGSAGKPRVLLADDEPIVRDVLATELEDAGYAVTAAPDGKLALAQLTAAGPFDILVTDLAMPGLDGVAVIREAQRRQPGLPAILLTGYAGDVASLALGTGFTLMRKPVVGITLADQIAALLGRTGGGVSPAR
ncbi:hybrid sensor histidine kinase/response regulator [Muricoccus aerilatus]|uniref:hybrid sensor histidine kinase/response regulator n=1 Tax=Muricoccus aerilatus TaxID=452982 RepID=UPI00069484E5|nr:ATP-binding protein [Roseomonas aerilata]